METEGPTVIDKPPAVARDSAPSIASPPPNLSVAISEQAVAAVEAQRMRGLLNGLAGSAIVTVLLVFIVAGDSQAKRIHAGALATSAIVSFAVALWFRDPKRYHRQLALYVIIGQVFVLVTGYYFWGVFSAYGALVPLTVYIACGSATRTEAIAGVTLGVVAQTAFSLAVVLGYVDARGLVEPVTGRADLATQLIAIGLIQVITIGAAFAGTAARRDSTKVLDAHNQVLLDLARREAQLAEAYADARAAREAGLGGMGRFTDQMIDNFKLGEVLGRGAMGEVYAAQREGDWTPLAMKILAPHLLSDATARERFLRETAIVSSLASPHVVKVVAVAPVDAVLPYIVMERLTGTDLGQLLKKRPLLPLADIVQIVTHVAKGLDAAHKAGVIHRDLKPTNIYAQGDGPDRTWKILDFGASKWRDGDGTLTQDNIVGTPGYMAPEQALCRPIDPRSDVYALGILIYRLLTGVPAVVPGEIPAMLQEVSFRMPVQPSKRGNVAPGLEAVLAVALAKSPVHRFATAGELAYAFEQAVHGKLDRGIAHRAEALLEDLPWGAWQRQ